ncbi:MAG: type I-C CRISPR-associated protein Cas8c/Csd1 [Oscillospiraceae bacterium]|nr:type I-C CRISPR-associated protein Cas8c/Csd1 [Oscillospiraceae bacterium]
MSWTNELYEVYRKTCTDPDSGVLPVSHSTANAQIEVCIDEHGRFKGADTVAKENAVTIIPVTEDSGARSSGICPMPFADKLVYIAGDYPAYAEGKRADNTAYFHAYMEQLDNWRQSDHTHPAVSAVFAYLQDMTLMRDLVNSGILKTEPETGKLLPNTKLAGIAQEDAFVRFLVQYDDITHESRTWMDRSLYDSFIRWGSSQMGNEQLCYATGGTLPATYKHPSKVRNAGDKAKLISSNDESGFTYRGRFSGKEEALSVSYDFSQKMHNALKWLITKQGQSYGSLTLVTWASSLAALPNELGKQPIEDEWDEEEAYDSLPLYKKKLQQHLLGYGANYPPDAKVMLLGLDAATTGRLSIAVYDELQASDFLGNLEHWHGNCAWMRYDGKHKTNCIRSFSLYEIIRAAYGTEQNGKLECDDKLTREQILRLLPCVMNGRPVPYDLVQVLYRKASNPLAYEQYYNHRLVIETACGMYRAFLKGEISMGYDPNETDRSYLYGCLLAIADKAESDTYEDADKLKRVTNARRFWVNFAQRPYQTWQTIEERLRPYLNHHNFRVQAEKWMQEIMGKFTPGSFADNSRLDPMYLLGYHHFMEYMWKKNQDMKEEN